MHPDEIPDINDSETISDQPKPKKSPAELLAERINASIPVAPVPALAPPNPPLMDEAHHKLHEELKRCNQLRMEAERVMQRSAESLGMVKQLTKEVEQLNHVKLDNEQLKVEVYKLSKAVASFKAEPAFRVIEGLKSDIERRKTEFGQLEERLEQEAVEHKTQLRSSESTVTKLTIAVCFFAAVAGSLGCMAWRWRPSHPAAIVAPATDSVSRDQPMQTKSPRPRRIIDITPKEESTEFRVISDEPQGK